MRAERSIDANDDRALKYHGVLPAFTPTDGYLEADAAVAHCPLVNIADQASMKGRICVSNGPRVLNPDRCMIKHQGLANNNADPHGHRLEPMKPVLEGLQNAADPTMED